MESTETTIQPEPVVERIVHAPVPPAPGAEDQKPIPAATDETANAADTAAESTEQQEAHRQSKFQRRLDRQKQARFQAEAEARFLREQRDELRARLEGQARQAQDTGEPNRDQYSDYEAYLRAVTRWEADQATDKRLRAEREERQGRERQQQSEFQARTEYEKASKSWIEREKAFKAGVKDYDRQVNAYLDESEDQLSKDARELIIESELGPQLLHHLALNPDEAERIAELSPRRQLIELGKLEDRLPKPGSSKKTTNAPPPASTVRQGANSADGIRENMTQAEVANYMRSHGSRWVR